MANLIRQLYPEKKVFVVNGKVGGEPRFKENDMKEIPISDLVGSSANEALYKERLIVYRNKKA